MPSVNDDPSFRQDALDKVDSFLLFARYGEQYAVTQASLQRYAQVVRKAALERADAPIADLNAPTIASTPPLPANATITPEIKTLLTSAFDGVTYDPPSARETHEQTDNSWKVNLDGTPIRTLEDLLAYVKPDLLVWHVKRFKANKWAVAAKDADGKLQVEPLFQTYAEFERNPQVAAGLAEIEALRIKADGYAPCYSPVVRIGKPKNELLALLSPCDVHFGKLCWAEETGGANYDLGIANSLFDTAMAKILDRLSGYDFSKILLVLGNDMLHFDNLIGTTTAGTPQDRDGRYHKVFGVARDASIRLVEKLRLLAPVEVVMVPGNHDNLAAWHLGDSLQSWFRQCGDVEVDNRPLPRKYKSFGKNLFGFAHGDKGKKADYPLLMAQEEKQLWGVTEYREFYLGHLHSEQTTEKMGVKVRVLPSLTAADSWHSAMGYVGAIRSTQAFVWDSTEGLIGIHNYNHRETE